MPTPVKITAADNELYIIATSTSGVGSSELFHIKNGYNDPVNTVFNLESVLPKGTWQLVFVGINWGGPWAFKITVGSNGYGNSAATGPVGIVWSQTIPPITI